MIWLYLVAFVVMAAGIVLLLGLTPEKITDDLMGIFVPKQNLRDKILIAQGKKKSRKLTKEILHIKDALDATGKANQFTAACAASVVLMIVGCIFSVMIDNFFMIPVAAVIFASLPFFFARSTINAYDKQMKEELETALSIVTTSYVRTDDILSAVKENLPYLKPPIREVFTGFLGDAMMVSSDTKQALRNMREKIDNAIFAEWAETLIACQDDRTLKDTLLPIVSKLTDVRIVNNELKTMLGEVQKEYWTMVVLLVCNIPLIYVLNKDWFETLIFSIPGKIVLALSGLVVVVTSVLMMRFTRPVEYKR